VRIIDVINLEVDIQIAKDRLRHRALKLNRSDDLDDVAVSNRLKVYLDETKQVLDNFKHNDIGYDLKNDGTSEQA